MPDSNDVPLNLHGEPMAPGEADAYWNRRRLPKLAHIERTFVGTGKLSEEDWHCLLLSDHTPKGQHCLWLATRMSRGLLKQDGLATAVRHLDVFTAHKRSLPVEHRDLMRCRDPEALEALVRPYVDLPPKLSKKERKRQERNELDKDMPLLYEDDACKVHWAATPLGARHLGRSTRWCTASNNSTSMFQSYNSTGDLIVITPKRAHRKHERYQYHWNHGVMNEKDRPSKRFSVRYPKAWEFVQSHPLSSFSKVARRYSNRMAVGHDDVAEIESRLGRTINGKEWLHLIKANDRFIDLHPGEPTPKMIAAACQKNPERIFQYDGILPDEKVQDILVAAPRLLRLANPRWRTEERLLAITQANPRAVAFLDPEDITEPLAETSVSTDPKCIRFLSAEMQTEGLQEMAVRADPDSIDVIKAPTRAVQRTAVRLNPEILPRLPDPDPALVMEYLDDAKDGMQAFERLPLAQRQKSAEWALDSFALSMGRCLTDCLATLPDHLEDGNGAEEAADSLEAAVAEQIEANITAARRMGMAGKPYLDEGGGLNDLYEIIDLVADGEVARALGAARSCEWVRLPDSDLPAEPQAPPGPALAAG